LDVSKAGYDAQHAGYCTYEEGGATGITVVGSDQPGEGGPWGLWSGCGERSPDREGFYRVRAIVKPLRGQAAAPTKNPASPIDRSCPRRALSRRRPGREGFKKSNYVVQTRFYIRPASRIVSVYDFRNNVRGRIPSYVRRLPCALRARRGFSTSNNPVPLIYSRWRTTCPSIGYRVLEERIWRKNGSRRLIPIAG